MTRATDEWIATHDDQAIPPRVRLRVFEKHHAHCPKCERKLRPGHWACDHIIALINGGQHRESNLQPLCDSPCHSNKTREDVGVKSKAYSRRAKDAGVRTGRKTLGGRKFDGTPILPKWTQA